jgi:hypothetical protein
MRRQEVAPISQQWGGSVMGSHQRPRLVVWISILLLAAQVGCAARGATLAARPGPTVGAGDRKACEDFAEMEAGPSGAHPVALGAFFTGALFLGFYMAEAIVRVADDAIRTASRNRKAREAAYERALTACLEPRTFAETVGVEHSDVVGRIQHVANRYAEQGKYAEAERLYQRALAVREELVGPGHPEVATTLDGYAALLRKLDRATDAEALEARAAAIRARQPAASQRESGLFPSIPVAA